MTGTAPTIAATLIVRNGVRTLARLLDSIRPYVDEVCVLDTGSDDGTLELLEQAASAPGAPIRVKQEEWRGDFAWARNRADEMASSDYLVWFDDDDILEGGEHLRPLLATHRPDVVYVRCLDLWNASTPAGSPGGVRKWFGVRAWRRGVGSWCHPVNEVLCVPTDASWLVARPDAVRVLHRPLNVAGRHGYEDLIRYWLERQPSRHLLSALAWERFLVGDMDEMAALIQRQADPDDPLPDDPPTGPLLRSPEASALQALALAKRERGDELGALLASLGARRALLRLYEHNPLAGLLSRLDDEFPIRADDQTVWPLQPEEMLTERSEVAVL